MIYTLGELTACIKEQCQQIKTLQDALGDLQNPTLDITYKPVYEYRDIWAEESGGTNPNNAQWSFGNGATGYIGLPIDAGWEVIQLGFHADTYPSTATIQIDLMSYNTPSLAAANTIASVSLTSATDGGGTINNAYKLADVSAVVPAGVVGFITRGATGNISDARVYARLRRQVGTCVEDVSV